MSIAFEHFGLPAQPDFADVIRGGIKRRVDINEIDLAPEPRDQEGRQDFLVIAVKEQIVPAFHKRIVGRLGGRIFNAHGLAQLRREMLYCIQRLLADPVEHWAAFDRGDFEGFLLHLLLLYPIDERLDCRRASCYHRPCFLDAIAISRPRSAGSDSIAEIGTATTAVDLPSALKISKIAPSSPAVGCGIYSITTATSPRFKFSSGMLRVSATSSYRLGLVMVTPRLNDLVGILPPPFQRCFFKFECRIFIAVFPE